MKIMKDEKAESSSAEDIYKMEDLPTALPYKMEDSESRMRRHKTLNSLLTPPTAADPVSASFADLMGVDEDYYYDDEIEQYFYDDDVTQHIQLEAVNGAIGQAKANDGAKGKGHRTSRFTNRRTNFNHRRLGGTAASGGGLVGGATGLSGIEYTNAADALSGGITGLTGGGVTGGLNGLTGIGNTGGSGGGGGADSIGSRRTRNRRRNNNSNNNGLRRSAGGFAGGYGSGYGGSGYGGGRAV